MKQKHYIERRKYPRFYIENLKVYIKYEPKIGAISVTLNIESISCDFKNPIPLSKILDISICLNHKDYIPAVKKRETMIRITVTSNHTEEDIERILKLFHNIGLKMNLIQ